uniref:Uncharacterized protein n=1 Tax=Sus scrofa TaxID=9823 RepID=A0A8D0YDS7_PIG
VRPLRLCYCTRLESPGSRFWHIWCLVKAHFLVPGGPSCCVLTRHRGEAFQSIFYKVTHLIYEGSALKTQSPPRASTSRHHHTGD